MAQLRLLRLKCHQTEDLTGPDEAYLRVNGSIVWGPVSTNNGQEKDLTGISPISFFGSVSVELFDQDAGGFPDPDDLLGAVSVNASQAGLGSQMGTFTGDGANYELVYQVF